MATDDQRKSLEKWLKYCLRMRKKQRWRFADLAGLVILWQSLKHKGSWEPELAPLLVGLRGKQALFVSSLKSLQILNTRPTTLLASTRLCVC